jgi:hypothetical protein
LSLSWAIPPGCPPAAAVEAEFVRLLGGPTRTPSSKRIKVQGRVRRLAQDRWSVQLETDIDGAKGHRQLEGDSCPSITAAAALILALTIDPDAASRAPASRAESLVQQSATTPSPSRSAPAAAARSLPPSPPQSPPQPPSSSQPSSSPSPSATAPVVAEAGRPSREPAPEPREAEPPPVEAPAHAATEPVPAAAIAAVVTAPKPSAPWPVRPFLRTFVGGALALLPQPAAIAGVAIGARRGRFDLEISGLASQERRAPAPDRPTAAGEFRLLSAGARGCGRIGNGWIIPRLCAGVEIERISARGTGVEIPRWGTATMAAAVGTGVLAIPLGKRFELALELAGSVRSYRPAFELDKLGWVFVVPTAAAAATVGVTVNL